MLSMRRAMRRGLCPVPLPYCTSLLCDTPLCCYDPGMLLFWLVFGLIVGAAVAVVALGVYRVLWGGSVRRGRYRRFRDSDVARAAWGAVRERRY